MKESIENYTNVDDYNQIINNFKTEDLLDNVKRNMDLKLDNFIKSKLKAKGFPEDSELQIYKVKSNDNWFSYYYNDNFIVSISNWEYQSRLHYFNIVYSFRHSDSELT